MIPRSLGLTSLAACLALLWPAPLFAQKPSAQPPAASRQHIASYPTRQNPDDLEIGGDLAGLPAGSTRFVTYADLLKLPQVTATVTGDENFTGPVQVSGVLLEKLPALLGAAPDARMITAICDDLYNAHYPAAYLSAHHPILVLRINGFDHAHWPLGVDKVPMGPYMISHASFHPAFKVLSHEEEPQVPWGVLRLDLRREPDVYRPILPLGPHAQEETVQQGYTIARENCFRCHANRGEGGTKSTFGWDTLSRMAIRRPDWFAQYVRDPKSINPKTNMAAAPQYDDATMAALRAYYATFTATAAPAMSPAPATQSPATSGK